ncbi:MAG TPA: hypothetical protein VIM86_14175 [Thermodesulfobacteriota bacterium]
MGGIARTARRLAVSTALVLLAGALGCAETAGPAGGPAAGEPAVMGRQGQRVPGEYLVTVRAGTDERRIRDLFAEYQVAGLRRVRDDVFLLRIAKDPGPEAVRARGLSSPDVTAVQPNYAYRP